jgi:hypothetical protein
MEHFLGISGFIYCVMKNVHLTCSVDWNYLTAYCFQFIRAFAIT